MEDMITKKYKIFTIIAGIFTLIPVLNIIYNFLGLTNEWLYYISFYGLKIIGILIYIFILKNLKRRQIIYIVLFVFNLLISILFLSSLNNVSGGLDSLGKAMAIGLLFDASMYLYYIIAFLLYMSYAKKFVFKKNAIIRAVIVLLLVIVIYLVSYILRVERIDESKLVSVKDFENELISRNICNKKCNTSTDTKLYGIKKGLKKADDLSFYSDSDKKYPLYVYASVKKENENNWIMYYINGNLYAVNGYYYLSNFSFSNEEQKVIIGYPKIMVSESNKIVTYNPKLNVFEETESLWVGSFNYYAEDGGINIFIDYPEATKKEYNFFNINVVERVDKSTLDKIEQKRY